MRPADKTDSPNPPFVAAASATAVGVDFQSAFIPLPAHYSPNGLVIHSSAHELPPQLSLSLSLSANLSLLWKIKEVTYQELSKTFVLESGVGAGSWGEKMHFSEAWNVGLPPNQQMKLFMCVHVFFFMSFSCF